MGGQGEARRGLLRSAAYTAAGRIAGLLVGFVLSPVILSRLGDEGFADWVVGLAFAFHLNILSELGSGLALTWRVADRRAAEDPGGLRASLGAHALLSLLSALPKALAALAALLWFGEAPPWLVPALILALLRPALQAWECLLAGAERFDELALMALLRAALWAAFVLIATAEQPSGALLLLGEVGIMALLAPLGFALARRALPTGLGLRWPDAAARGAHFRYGASLAVSQVCELLNSQSDKLLLGGQPVDVRSYELGQKVALPARTAMGMLCQVLAPSVPGILAEEGGAARLASIHRRAQKLIVTLAAGAFTGLAVCAPRAAAAWLGAAAVDETIVLAMRGLLLAQGLLLLAEVPLQLARGLNELAVERRGTALFSLLGLALRVGLLLAWGIPGLVLGAVATSLALTAFWLWRFAPLLGAEPWPHLRETTLPALLAAAIAAALTLAAGLGPWVEASAQAAWGAGRSAAALGMLAELALFTPLAILAGALLGVFDEDWAALARRARNALSRRADA